MTELRCMCGGVDCSRCYPASAVTLVPCADCGEPCPPDLDSLFPATHSTCDACNEARADAVAASLPGQEIENEGWL